MWLENGVFGSSVSVEELQVRDASRAPGLAWGRLVALWDWQIVGAAEAQQKADPWLTRSEIHIGVRPDYRGLGIAHNLLRALEAGLRDAGGEGLVAYSGDLEAEYNGFLWHAGFREAARGYSQFLALHGYDLERFSVNWNAILAAGVEFRTLSEVRFEWDCAQKLYELYCTLENDVPRVDEWFAPKSFDDFCADLFDSDSSLPDGVMLAVRVRERGMEYVGCNILYRDTSGSVLHNGLARSELNWHPAIDMSTGIERTARWMKATLAGCNSFLPSTSFSRSSRPVPKY